MSKEQLALALGVNVRTLLRYCARGLTTPVGDESVEAWVARANEWRRSNRGRAGRKAEPRSDGEQSANLRYREAKAELAELDLAERRGELHSRVECERTFVSRCAELRAAFSLLPQALARKLYQAPSPDAIALVVEQELRRIFEVLSGEHAHVGDP